MTESRWLPIASRLLAEFCVIVLGVLVALAVDEWRQTKAEEQLAIEYLEALVLDLKRDINEYEGSRQFISGSVRGIDHVLAAVSGNQAENPYPSLAEALRRSSWVNYPAWTSGTLSELVNSGTIRLIRDPQLKRAMLDYYERLEEWKPRIMGPEYATFIEFRRHTAGWLPPSMNSFSGTEPSAEENAKLEADLLQKVKGNDQLFALASGMREDWSLITGFMGVFAERATDLQNQIETALGNG